MSKDFLRGSPAFSRKVLLLDTEEETSYQGASPSSQILRLECPLVRMVDTSSENVLLLDPEEETSYQEDSPSSRILQRSII